MGCLSQHQGMPLHPDRSKVPQRHRRNPPSARFGYRPLVLSDQYGCGCGKFGTKRPQVQILSPRLLAKGVLTCGNVKVTASRSAACGSDNSSMRPGTASHVDSPVSQRPDPGAAGHCCGRNGERLGQLLGGLDPCRELDDQLACARRHGVKATISPDMAFELDVNLPPALEPLAWLVGRWEGAGVVGYPTIESAHVGQEIVCSHDGRPFLEWHSRTWLLDDDGNRVRPLATKLGFWHVLESGEIEPLLTHPTRVVEMYIGHRDPAKPAIELRTDGVRRSPAPRSTTPGRGCTGWRTPSCSG